MWGDVVKVKAEGAEDLTTWPLVVINHYVGDYEMYTVYISKEV